MIYMKKYLFALLGVAALVFVANYLVLAFNEPTAAPPNDNVAAPLNIGPEKQTKNGPLEIVGELRSVAAANASINRLWGQGRPRAGVVNANGECQLGSIKASRSNRTVAWEGAAAACPSGWWVCTAGERGAGACSTTIFTNGAECNGSSNLDNPQYAWVADTDAVAVNRGVTVRQDGKIGPHPVCELRRVWCCANR